MDALPKQPLAAGDFYDISEDEALEPQLPPPSASYGGDMGEPDMSHVTGIDRNEYSDEDIRIVYEIVVRAETILADELTPSTRLPTHALFLAYDEILADYRMDPNERHISKLVFMVGGVKGRRSLLDKFKAVMARMNITLDIEDARGFEVENGAEHLPTLNDEYMTNAHDDDVESNSYKSSGDCVPEQSTGSLDVAKERSLADKAAAFRRWRHSPYSVVATFRTWHSSAHYVNYVCDQSDAARDADLEDAACDIFCAWRTIAAEAEKAAPHNVPANTYSKRTERIAIRTNEILSARKALAKWRQLTQLAQYEYQHKLMTDQLPSQAYDDEDFKENPQLARLAKATHKNLAMSRAFTTWSNRVEEEAGKSEIAAKAYEMGLKAKALGVPRNRSVVDAMAQFQAGDNVCSVDAPAVQAVTQATAPVPSHPHPPIERSTSALAIPTQLELKTSAESQPDSFIVRPSTVIPITAPSAIMTIPAAVTTAAPGSAPPIDPVIPSKCAEDADNSDDDQSDEQTMLARRHILRMRYFGAWQKYTSEHVAKVKQFGEEIEGERVTQSISTWRDQAASRQRQTLDGNIGFDEARSYQKVMTALPKWRERASGQMHHQEEVLEHYAKRAEYYQRTKKTFPLLRDKTQQAIKKEQLLNQYATRTNYFMRTTQALSSWRQRAQDASKKHQLQQEYGERADYYYKTRNTLFNWRQQSKQRRKDRLREAHLETRRRVKKNMGGRCIKQWRDQLEPSYARYEVINVVLADALEDRGWKQKSQAFTTWRRQAQERAEAQIIGDDMLKQKAVEQWRATAALHRDLEPEAKEHWENKTKSRALRTWNLSSLQSANRPEMVANASEKKERKLLRQGFETWYGRTADKLVPVELPDGSYKNVGQVVKDARRQGIQHQAQGLLSTWRVAAAAATATESSRASQTPEEAYAPTPGRPHLLLGSFGSRETTTPLAPMPNYSRWQARDSTMGKSEYGAKPGRIVERTKDPKNLRVSWAA